MKKDKNVLFILCDQFRSDSTGFNSNKIVKTPNLDRLALNSTNFVNAHTICPLCSPARGTLLSGKIPQNNGVIDNLFVGASNQKPLGNEVNTWLKEAGKNNYQTAYFGKWHLGKWEPSCYNVTFDMSALEFVDSRNKKCSRANAKGELREGVVLNEKKDWNRDGELDSSYKMPFYGKLDSEEGMRDFKSMKKTVSFLDNTDDNTPWCVTTSFKSPHFPLGIPDPYYSMYDWKDMELPQSFYDNFQNKPWFQNRHWWPLITDRFSIEDWKKTIAAYYGLISLTDKWIGNVLNSAKKNSHGRETLVIFTADHGEMLGAHSRFDKAAYFYEEAIRIPLLICNDLNNESNKPEIRNEYVSTLDTSKTLYKAVDADGEEGRDLVSLIDGTSQDEWKDEVFAEYHRYNAHLFEIRMIKTPEFKYCFNPQDIDELYDLRNDKEELHNLSDDERYIEIKKKMKKRLFEHLKEVDDNILQTLENVPPAGCVL
jgi:arylsulfatase A-like enzyme